MYKAELRAPSERRRLKRKTNWIFWILTPNSIITYLQRAQEEKQSRPHREPLKEATPVKRDSLALACSSVCDVSVFIPRLPFNSLTHQRWMPPRCSALSLSSRNTAEKSNFQTKFAPGNREMRRASTKEAAGMFWKRLWVGLWENCFKKADITNELIYRGSFKLNFTEASLMISKMFSSFLKN